MEAARAHNAALDAAAQPTRHLPDAEALAWLAHHLNQDLPAAQAQQLVLAYQAHSQQVERWGLPRTLDLLRVHPQDRELLQRFFHLPDTLGDRQWEAAIQAMRTQADALPHQHRYSQYVLAIAQHSYAYWDLHLPVDSDEVQVGLPRKKFLNDSLRKLRRKRIAKADAGGALKGVTFGAIQFGTGVWWLDMPQNDAAVTGSLTLVLFSVFDSFSYARKLRRGLVKLADDPWWGPPTPQDTSTTKPIVVPKDATYDG